MAIESMSNDLDASSARLRVKTQSFTNSLLAIPVRNSKQNPGNIFSMEVHMTSSWQNLKPTYPPYFNETDLPWVSRLFNDYEKFVGKSRRELQIYFRSLPNYGVSSQRFRLIFQSIDAMWPKSKSQIVDPRQLRLNLFRQMAAVSFKEDSWDFNQFGENWLVKATEIKKSHEINASLQRGTLDLLLFSDLSSEQTIQSAPANMNPREIIMNANQSYLRSLLARSRFICLSVDGHARAVLRQIKLKRLLVSVRSVSEGDNRFVLIVSGPLSLFRQTRIYARALSSIIPVLAWCPKFTMEIYCPMPHGNKRYIIRSGDPIFPGTAPREFDSGVEMDFAKQFNRLTKNWDLMREPAPIPVGDSWIFPDFKITHRHDPSLNWFLEIVGYWTPEYLKKKIVRLKEAKISNLILCVDRSLGVDEPDWPKGWIVIPYKKRVNPKDVVTAIQVSP